MKHPMKAIFSISVFALLSLLTICLTGLDAKEPPKKVAILPFTMHAQEGMDYLREGILDMLATRLYWKDQVTVMEKGVVRKAMADHQGPVDPGYAEQLGRDLGADYVLFGSVTVFGESVSLDATMASITQKEDPVTVFTQTKGMASVIPEVNMFAQKINAQVFRRPDALAQAAAPSQPQTVAPMKPAIQGPTASPLNPGFMQHQRLAGEEGSFWRSHTLKAEITGMDIGDVDGDGQNELVLMQGTDIVVYRFQDERLLKLAAFTASDKNRFIAVDVADINQNGRAEIFASKVRGTQVTSYVLELENGKLRTLVKESPWFYRVMDWPGKGRVLLGQEKMMGSIGGGNLANTYFRDEIFHLVWNGSDYVPSGEGPLLDLRSVYIYNFAIGDLTGDGVPEIVRIDHWGNLHLMDQAGETLHKTNEAYGGTLNAILTNPDAPELSRHPVQAYLFIPARILIADLDKDGRNEIIINQNHSSVGDFTERFKAYSNGKIVSLSWNGLSLNANWESQKLNGTLSDYQIKDLDNDGRPDLVVAMLKQRGAAAFMDAKSVVVSYKLNLGKQG